jgi:hypothetical protein
VNTVDEGRAGRVWASIDAIARREGAPPSIRHVCLACAAELKAGVGLSMTRDGGLREPVFATDPASEELQELQFTLGEGPCVDALTRHGTVLAADLSGVEYERRWPIFAPAVRERGIEAVFSFPVQAGAVRFGVLDVYRPEAGPLCPDELTDALLYADAAFGLALDDQGGITATVNNLLGDGFVGRQAALHQAAGMVSVQLGVTVAEGLARLRGYAFANDLRLGSLAVEVVARRLRFHPDALPPGAGGPRDNGADPSTGTTKDVDR